MDELANEMEVYRRHKTRLEADHLWEWIVIHGDEIVGTYSDFQDAAQEAVSRFGRGPYLIREIGAPKQFLSSSVLYNPIHAIR